MMTLQKNQAASFREENRLPDIGHLSSDRLRFYQHSFVWSLRAWTAQDSD